MSVIDNAKRTINVGQKLLSVHRVAGGVGCLDYGT